MTQTQTFSFTDLALRPEIHQALAKAGYTTPTPIQAKAIPHALQGRDLLGIAQTGTGKTAAFTLPILERLSGDASKARGKAIGALILTPTRELAIQIAESVKTYGAHLHLRHAVIFGGVGQQPQVDALRRGIDILIATPGRLLDLMNQRHVRFDHLEVLVLDEADRMLDMGFINDVRKVVAAVPAQRQTMLFSATMPREIADLAARLLTDPVRVEATPPATTVERIDQRVIFAPQADKRHLLVALLGDPTLSRTIVFARTKHGANKVVEHLVKAGIGAAAIHGNKSQSARQAALQGFKAGQLRVLVATDIAARGIDVDGISHVLNYELPNVPETYVHRIGRTARAGRDGIAISFCDPEERPFLRDIEKLTGRRLTVDPAPAFVRPPASAQAPAEAARPRGPGSTPPSRRPARPHSPRPAGADRRQEQRPAARRSPRG